MSRGQGTIIIGLLIATFGKHMDQFGSVMVVLGGVAMIIGVLQDRGGDA